MEIEEGGSSFVVVHKDAAPENINITETAKSLKL